MNDDFETIILPGETFESDGSKIQTLEGPMQGKVTLRTVAKQPNSEVWLSEIIGVSKPEWEWMLGKVVGLYSDYVKEQISKHF